MCTGLDEEEEEEGGVVLSSKIAKSKSDYGYFTQVPSLQSGSGYGKYVARSRCMRLDRRRPGRRSLDDAAAAL